MHKKIAFIIFSIMSITFGIKSAEESSAEESIDISGLNKKELVKELHKNARPPELDIIQLVLGTSNPGVVDLSDEEAEAAVYQGKIEYLKGRPMKIEIFGDKLLDAWLYNREHGEGAAEAIVQRLRNKANNK